MPFDGEHFDVTERIGEPGIHELRWFSGTVDPDVLMRALEGAPHDR